jgi:hypothetical protein
MANRYKIFFLTIFIAIFLLNDHYLKFNHPSLLTGKLSDFIGLFLTGWLLTRLKNTHGHRVMVVCFIAVVFSLYKVDFFKPLIMIFNQNHIFYFSQQKDYTDLLALVSLLPLLFYDFKIVYDKLWVKYLVYPLITVSLLATVGTTGNFGIIEYDLSKDRVYKRFTKLKAMKPELFASDSLHYYLLTRNFQNAQPLAKDLYSDSSNFLIKPSGTEDIIQMGFVKGTDDWNKPGSELAFIGIFPAEGRWKFEKDMNTLEEKYYRDKFFKEIDPFIRGGMIQ